MKRVLLLALVSFFALHTQVYAQIGFTESDFQPRIGKIRHAETFTASPTLFSPESMALQALAAQTGGNQTFDLTPYTFDPPDAIATEQIAFDVSGPGGNIAAFAGSVYIETLPAALNPSLPGDSYGFYSINNASLNLHGTLVPGLAQIENTPPEVIFELPLNFGNSWTSSHTQTSILPIGNTVQTVTLSQSVDGWGTLITPAGSVSCLRIRITREISNNGAVILTEEEIEFISKDGITAHMGYNSVFQMWGSVSYTVASFNPDVGGGNEGVLFVVDDAASLDASDQVVYNQMMDLGLVVEVMSDEVATTEDGLDRDLIVVSATIDVQVFAPDWRESAVPLLTWDQELYPLLGYTDDMPDETFGVTSAGLQLALTDASHPILHGSTGTIDVYVSEEAMTFGAPAGDAVVLAHHGDANGLPVLFTFDTGAMMTVEGTAPARRAGFFFNKNGANSATPDGLTLLENTLLWLLGREAEIEMSVHNEEALGHIEPFSLSQNYPNPFNRETTIEIKINRPSQVEVKIYDVLGREVATLANTQLPTGNHQIPFYINGLPGGIYQYTLQVDGLSVSRLMTVVK